MGLEPYTSHCAHKIKRNGLRGLLEAVWNVLSLIPRPLTLPELDEAPDNDDAERCKLGRREQHLHPGSEGDTGAVDHSHGHWTQIHVATGVNTYTNVHSVTRTHAHTYARTYTGGNSYNVVTTYLQRTPIQINTRADSYTQKERL